MYVEEGSAGIEDRGPSASVGRRPEGHREGTQGLCPRCGNVIPRRPTGRPARWCSQRCRRAAFEERRTATAGAIAVKLVETVTTTEHELDECVRRVQSSPVAVRKVLAHLTKQVQEDRVRDPKWGSVLDSGVLLARASECCAYLGDSATWQLSGEGHPRRW